MSSTKSPTGADLPVTFIQRRSPRARWYGVGLGFAKQSWEVHEAVSATDAMPGSGTVPLYARDGFSQRALGTGLVVCGTASQDTHVEDVLAARGGVTVLDAWRIGENGRRERIGTECVVAVEDPGSYVAEHALMNTWGFTLGAYVPLRVGRPGAVDAAREAGDSATRGIVVVKEELPDAPDTAGPGLEMVAMARAMTDIPAAIRVQRPEVPELTDSSLENAKRLFGLTAVQLAQLFGVTERQMRRYLSDAEVPVGRKSVADALMAIGLTVVGGLGPAGAQEWLYSGVPTGVELLRGGRIEEIMERAEALRDSPFT